MDQVVTTADVFNLVDYVVWRAATVVCRVGEIFAKSIKP